MNADYIDCEWDEDGFSLRLFIEGTVEGMDSVALSDTVRLRFGDPLELYQGIRKACDDWVAEMRAAEREYRSGVADDPAMQAKLDLIRAEQDEHKPQVEEDPADVPLHQREGGEVLRDMADHVFKSLRENG